MHSYLLSIPIIILALVFVIISLWVLITKKPMITSYRWHLAVMLVFLLHPLYFLFTPHHSYNAYLLLLVWVFILIVIYYRSPGYQIFAADEDDFRKVFIENLKQLNYEFEETISSVKIKEPPMEILISNQLGVVRIRFSNRADKETANKIIRELKNKKIKATLIYPLLILVIGLLILIMGLWRYYSM